MGLGDGWHFVKSDGTWARHWLYYGVWYYFGNDRAMRTAWQIIDKQWHYFNECRSIEDGRGEMFRKSDDGNYGIYVISGKRYCFSKSGALFIGWYNDPNTGQRRYFSENGEIKNGWSQIKNTYYYFSNYSLVKSGFKTISGNIYYLDTNTGAMATGFKTINGNRYYFNGSGTLLKPGWSKINHKWFYMKSSGIIMTGRQKINGHWYFLNSSGVMLTGWNNISGKWYYMNSSGAKVRSQWVGNFYLKSDGIMATSQWVDKGRYYVNAQGSWVPGKRKAA